MKTINTLKYRIAITIVTILIDAALCILWNDPISIPDAKWAIVYILLINGACITGVLISWYMSPRHVYKRARKRVQRDSKEVYGISDYQKEFDHINRFRNTNIPPINKVREN
jgi:hypothetical protein